MLLEDWVLVGNAAYMALLHVFQKVARVYVEFRVDGLWGL